MGTGTFRPVAKRRDSRWSPCHHDWEDEDDDGVTVRGYDLPRDHPMHVMFLDYYLDMGVPEDFYWYTLEVAPPERIHRMSDEEILVYEMATD